MNMDTRYLPNRGIEPRGSLGPLTPRRLLMLAVVAVLVAVAYFGSRGDGEPDTSGHEQAVVKALDRSGFAAIEVTEEGDVVVLSGSVETEADRFAADRVARSVDDVVEIDNRITTIEVVEEAAAPGAATAPAIELQASLSEAVGRDPIVFGSASPEIAAESLPVLDEIALILDGQSGFDVEVGGHTDADGEDAANLALSEQRAAAVVAYLETQGVDPARLSSVGYGETAPVADNDTGEGKERNRRIEFRVVG